MAALEIDGRALTILDVAEVARGGREVALSARARQAMRASRDALLRQVRGGARIYGVNTGFGVLARERVSEADAAALQENILRSHASGCGEPFEADVVRAAMLLKANDFAAGRSGVRPELADALLALLNSGVVPVVPRQGSLAASGDLAPLAHLALPLIGRGRATVDGVEREGAAALAARRLEPLALELKEGLSLVNGTQVTTSLLALAVRDAHGLVLAAEVAAAMSLEALCGKRAAFDPRIAQARPHPGAAATAANLLRLTEGSEILARGNGEGPVQDPYSLRCLPQVMGAVRDSAAFVRDTVERELNSRTDNPLVFAESGEVLSGGNFHGEPLGFAADQLKIVLCKAAGMSERRTYRLLDPHASGLPSCLVENAGLNSGFMVAQYTAAALVSESKVLAHPASVDSIPTSQGIEDHVSMGCHGALQARQVLENARWVVAIEAACAAQGLDFRAPLRPGRGVAAAHRAIRGVAAHLDSDREFGEDIARIRGLLVSGRLVRDAEEAAGGLEE